MTAGQLARDAGPTRAGKSHGSDDCELTTLKSGVTFADNLEADL
jgi:hypothetical protein